MIHKEDLIYIAGHNGMVGSSIHRYFQKKGFKNLLTIDKTDLDLTDEIKVSNWFKNKKPKVVILAAAKVGGIYENSRYPTEFLIENIKIQNNIILNSWQNDVKRLLFLGSSCIYPKFAKQPITEEELLSGYLEPTNESYAIAKIVGMRLCKSLREQYNFDSISLMPTNLYGTGDNYDLISSHVLPALIRKFYDAKLKNEVEVCCWGTGNVYREFLHVDDLARACHFALTKWDPEDEKAPKTLDGKLIDFLNVGTGKDLTIKQLASKISDLIGYQGSIVWDETKPDGTPRKTLDISRIKNLGWEPKISLEEGLSRTIEEFKKLSM